MLALRGENIIATPTIKVIHRFCDLGDIEYGVVATISPSGEDLRAIPPTSSARRSLMHLLSLSCLEFIHRPVCVAVCLKVLWQDVDYQRGIIILVRRSGRKVIHSY